MGRREEYRTTHMLLQGVADGQDAMTGGPKDRPPRVLGGSLFRAPNGYRCLIQTTGRFYPAPMVVRQIYANASEKRNPKAWDGTEPQGALVIYLTDPIDLTCERCGGSLGSYVAYWARAEYGVLDDSARHYHPRENFPPDHFKNSPQDRLAPANPRFELDGEVGFRAARSIARFRCANCGGRHEHNLRRLGKRLFDARPGSFPIG